MRPVSTRDIIIAAQLDDTTPSDEAVSLINQLHARLDQQLRIIETLASENDRQDTTLTELESKVLDLEAANQRLREALSGFARLSDRVEQLARLIARSNLRCQ